MKSPQELVPDSPPIVLIVDDNPINVEVLATFMEKAGISIRMATDGTSALQIADFSPPDLIVLDILMPDPNGFEVCRRLKLQEKTQPIPVIFISSLSDPAEKMQGFSLGAVDFITKPFQQEEVLARVQLHLQLRALHQQLARQNIRLQQELVERDRIEQELREAKLNAEAASRAKSIFLAKMSHELRTPLNAIMGFGQLLTLDSQVFRPDHQEFLQAILHSGGHLLALINNVLEMAKIEAGTISLDPKPLRIRPFLSETLEMVKLAASQKSLHLGLELAPELPDWLEVDQSKLRQVLLNLIHNAIKFTDQGQVILRVFLQPSHALSGGNHHVRIVFEIQDTGMGILERDLDHIFKPFSQIQTNQKHHEGVGLGLSISEEYVRFMGGQISVHSRLNHGTTFRVELPLVVVADPLDPSPPQAKEPRLEATTPVLRILLVEDHPHNQTVMLLMLNSLGFSADLANNGLEALALMQEHVYDLILMDVDMPEMGGLETTQRIRQDPNRHQPIIVGVTAFAMKEDRERCLACGMDGYMSKPINLETLKSGLQDWQTKVKVRA